jgi:hypothetical protein
MLARTSCVMGLVLSGITEENHGIFQQHCIRWPVESQTGDLMGQPAGPYVVPQAFHLDSSYINMGASLGSRQRSIL